MTSRHVLVGLAHPRAPWPTQLAQWSNSGAAPIEFLTCLTGDEVRALLGSGRQVSAVLLDGASNQVGPELVSDVVSRGSTAIGVEAADIATDWRALGISAVLPSRFSSDQLAEMLGEHCVEVDRPPAPAHTDLVTPTLSGRGRLVAVCGPGGTGASCVAMGVAQGLAALTSGRVLLLDGARRADLAMYHDTGDVLPGLPELVERTRVGTPDPAELAELVFDSARGYDLMLGQRRLAEWATLRRPWVSDAIESLQRGWPMVVVDHDGDLEARSDTGSADLENRNATSLTLADRADVWLVVAGTGLKGLNDAARAVHEAAEAGVPEDRIQLVCNRTPRSPLTRSAITAAFAELTAGRDGAAGPPTFIDEIPRLEGIHRDAAHLPARLVEPVTRTTRRLLAQSGPRRIGDGSSRHADRAAGRSADTALVGSRSG